MSSYLSYLSYLSDLKVWREEYLVEEQSYGNKESSVIAQGILERWTTNQLLEELDTDEEGFDFMLDSFNDGWTYFCLRKKRDTAERSKI